MAPQKRKAFTPLDSNITNGDQAQKRYHQDIPQTPSPNRLQSTCTTQSSGSYDQASACMESGFVDTTTIEPNHLPSSSNSPPPKPKGKARTDPFQLPELPKFSPFRAEYLLHTSRVRVIA
ncbi:hypothetical protein B9Z19DRAFT_1063004 [Tuber borchii]|uniref:Uncharacterized protein n=1 Tax=Tuber borchii TaxID=42251 RepID=A0A2T7A003_TUBBO|nr:hypothetical protein B9Z19DRAFT_1063004 [Tuber borchii]